jgi:orotate phosphoribosyltransferase
MKAIFQCGDFTLHSGQKSAWKIECDSLTQDDWEGLARIASERLPPFGSVDGVPRGGIPFAKAMEKYITPGSAIVLICEDVVTTGASIEKHRAGRSPVAGVVVFARGKVPDWVTPLFQM